MPISKFQRFDYIWTTTYSYFVKLIRIIVKLLQNRAKNSSIDARVCLAFTKCENKFLFIPLNT